MWREFKRSNVQELCPGNQTNQFQTRGQRLNRSCSCVHVPHSGGALSHVLPGASLTFLPSKHLQTTLVLRLSILPAKSFLILLLNSMTCESEDHLFFRDLILDLTVTSNMAEYTHSKLSMSTNATWFVSKI